MNILDYAASVPTPADWTAAFQQAIADLRTRGGGTLIVPAGDYPTGAIRLYDNMTLHIESGAVLRFHQDASAFPLIDLEFEGIAGLAHQPCIYAEHAKNVTITGYGTLDGQGSYWWTRQRAGQNVHPRPYLVCFNHCEHVTLENVTLTNSPAWTVHPLYCRNVVIRGLNIKNPADSPNTDGIDLPLSAWARRRGAGQRNVRRHPQRCGVLLRVLRDRPRHPPQNPARARRHGGGNPAE